jgi:hypothetical protein
MNAPPGATPVGSLRNWVNAFLDGDMGGNESVVTIAVLYAPDATVTNAPRTTA